MSGVIAGVSSPWPSPFRLRIRIPLEAEHPSNWIYPGTDSSAAASSTWKGGRFATSSAALSQQDVTLSSGTAAMIWDKRFPAESTSFSSRVTDGP